MSFNHNQNHNHSSNSSSSSSNNNNNSSSNNQNLESRHGHIPIPKNTLIDTEGLPEGLYSTEISRQHEFKSSDYQSSTDQNNNSTFDRNSSIINNSGNKPFISRQKSLRPTLITGFNNGYNFTNNFISSPVEHSLIQPSSLGNNRGIDTLDVPQLSTSIFDRSEANKSFGDSIQLDSGSVTESSFNTPITIINKNLQNLQRQIPDQNLYQASPLAEHSTAYNDINNLLTADNHNVTNYRTQPNSFNDSYIETAGLKQYPTESVISPLSGNSSGQKENSIAVALSGADTENNGDIDHLGRRRVSRKENEIQCSTLLERDFPAEILPFELLDKKDGDYFINSEKVSSLSNNNYGSLMGQNDMYSDIINPLQDQQVMRRMRTLNRQNAPKPHLHHDDNDSDKDQHQEKHTQKKRTRTYSESETANFSTVTGERLYDDDKHRPIYSLHDSHQRLQDDSIHSTRNNSSLHVNAKPSAFKDHRGPGIYRDLDIQSSSSVLVSPEMSSAGSSGNEESVQVPVNITLHGGTIVPDENYRPKFMPRHSYNKEFGLAKTHQISTSTLELLNPGSSTKSGVQSGQLLHPNVEIYHNYESILGCEDEYIPGLDFKTSISQWFDDGEDYNRTYKLQLIGSHVHDKRESLTPKIALVKSFENQDELTLEVPNHDHNPILTDAPHDYTFKEIEMQNESESLKPLSRHKTDGTGGPANDPFLVSSAYKSTNQNLLNYKKDILNFNDYDYNNLYGGHDKFQNVPQYILNQKKKALELILQSSHRKSITQTSELNRDTTERIPGSVPSSPVSLKTSATDSDKIFEIHAKFGERAHTKPKESSEIVVLDSAARNISSSALSRLNAYNSSSNASMLNLLSQGSPTALNISPNVPKGNVKLEYGTVIENSVPSSTSSSISVSSPLVINDLRNKLRNFATDKFSGDIRSKGFHFHDKTSTANIAEMEPKPQNVAVPEQEKVRAEVPSPSVSSIADTDIKVAVNSKFNNKEGDVKKVNYEQLIDKLPDDFLQLPFSKRRKILLELLPPNDEHNKIDSKLLLSLIKKRFTKKTDGDETPAKSSANTSTAAKFLSRVNKAPDAKRRNIDDRGSIVMNHELGKIIGYGSWGIVRECYSLDEADNTITVNSADGTHRLVRAIKIVKTKNEIVRRCFKKEIKIWKLLNHKRLLPLLFVKETSYAIFCITPRIYGGTLFDIVSNWGYYNDPNSPIAISKRLLLIRKFIWEILDGISYMHYNGIVHGDLKLENCLIDEIVNPVTNRIENHILICDFGMSCFYIDPERSRKNSLSSARSSFTRLSAFSQPTSSSFFNRGSSGSLPTKDALNIPKRPQIPKSSSSENLSVSFNKMHEIAFDKSLTHDDTPIGISSFGKNYGPAPTSTTLNLSPIIFNYIQNEQPSNDKTPLPHTHIGSLPYASPEILLPNPPPLGPMADIWAFGVLTYTMAVGKLPFQHNFEPRLRAMISRGKYDSQCLQVACGNDPKLIEIIKGCLTKEITSRWDLDKIVQTLEN